MNNVHEMPWGGQPLDRLPIDRATDASWLVQRVYLREIEQGAAPDDAREAAISRLRWQHAREMLAAEAAIDVLAEGVCDVA